MEREVGSTLTLNEACLVPGWQTQMVIIECHVFSYYEAASTTTLGRAIR